MRLLAWREYSGKTGMCGSGELRREIWAGAREMPFFGVVRARRRAFGGRAVAEIEAIARW